MKTLITLSNEILLTEILLTNEILPTSFTALLSSYLLESQPFDQ